MQLGVNTTTPGILVLEFIKLPHLALTGKLSHPEFLEMTLHTQGNFGHIWKSLTMSFWVEWWDWQSLEVISYFTI